jgi:hypothetical protein
MFGKTLGLVLAMGFITACSGGDDTASTPDGLATTERGDTVVITDEWRDCEQDSDCVLVDTSCDGCCQRDAIATSLEATYGPAQVDACADYEGGECDCCFLALEAVCSDAGACEAVTPDGVDPNACI